MKKPSVFRFLSVPAITAVVAIAFSPTAPAAVQVYDSTNPAGVWDTTTLNWDGSTVAWTNGNDAGFDSGTGIVTVSTGISLGQLVISSTSESTIGGIGNSVYLFNGGSLDFGAAPGVIDTTGTGARNSQINSNLIGSAGLEISATGEDGGQGRLVLGGDNRGLTGGITLKAGLVVFTNPVEVLGSNTITLDDGGIFGAANHAGTGAATVNGADQGIANPVVLEPDVTNRIRVWGGRNLTLNGTLSGDGGFRKVDTGNLVLGATPTFSGELNLVTGGVISPTLQGLGSGNLTYSGSAQPTLGYYGSGETVTRQIHVGTSSGGILLNHGPGALTISNNISGAATPFGFNISGGGVSSMQGISTGALINFTKEGLGIWTVDGELTLAGGGIRPRSGILAFSASSSTAADAAITERGNANGILRFASGSSVKTATANTSGGILGGWATVDNTTWAKTNGTGNAIDGLATFTDDTWDANANTNVTLAGADPAADATTHSLRFNEAGAKTLALSGINTIESGGIMVSDAVGSNNTTITGGTLRGANNADLIVHQFNTGGDLTIESVISSNGTGTGLTKSGSGTLVISGANNYTGTTRVYEGTLRVTGNSGNKAYQVGSQGRLELDIDGGTSGYGRGILVNGAGVDSLNGVYLAGGRNFNLQSTLRLAGAPTTVRQFGTGNAILHGWDSNGTHLAVEPNASGSVIDTNINFQSGGFGYVMNISPGVSHAAGDLTIKGIFSGSTAYRKNGHGSVRLDGTGESNNTGTCEIRQGSVILAGGDNRLGPASALRLGQGGDSGLLVLEGVDQTFTALTVAGTGTQNRVVGGSATPSTLTINNSGDTTLAAHLGGPGTDQNNLSLAKNGGGTLSLSGSNTFTGDTTVNAGALRLDYSTNDNPKLSDTGTLTLSGNLILDGGSHEEIVGDTVVTGAATISRASGSAVVDLGELSRTGSATLNISEAGIARTSTANDPEGSLPSWVTIGGFPAANDGNGNIIPFVPTFTDIFRLGGQIPSDPSAYIRIVDGGTSGPITPAATGLSDILTLTQEATAGPATISLGSGDTLRLGEVGTITAPAGAGPLTIEGGRLTAGGNTDNPGMLSITGEAVVTISSKLDDNGTGPLALIKSGPGSLTLNAENDHTGGVTLSDGELRLGHEFALGLSGTLTINGGVLDNVTGDELIVTDSFPQVWSGDFTFLGSDNLVFQNGNVNITGNRQITVTASTLEIRTQVSGDSGFTKLGGGTLLLGGGGNNWAGTTTVAEGVLEVPSRSTDGPYVIDPNGTLHLGYITAGGYASTNMKIHGAGVSATTGLYLSGGSSYNASDQIELLTAPTTIRHYGEGLAEIGMFDINGNGMNVSADASGSVIDENIQMVSRGFGMSMTVAAGSETETGDLVINGPLNVGSLGFYKRGPGSVRLNGTATEGNEAVRIQGGRVITGTAGALGANADLPISSGATLDLNGFDQVAGSLSGAGSVMNGSDTDATLTINQTSDGTFSGTLGGMIVEEDNFALVKSGPSTLTLSGLNYYTGDTTITEGTLSIEQAFLAETSAVRVSTGAILNLPHGEAETVTALFIDGIQQPSGIYNSGNTSFITGPGSLEVTTDPSGDPFSLWAAANGLDGSPGKEAGFDEDPDGDGVANGLEWILGGNPLDGQSGALAVATGDATAGLTLSFTRNESSIGEATLIVEYNTDLGAVWQSVEIEATSSGPDANGVTVTIDTAASPDEVTVNIPATNAVGGRLFSRLKATQP